MKELNFRSDIQGLRAIAVLAVMAFHFNPALLPGGFIGVDVFLVISGFLITSILLKKKNQPDYSLGTTLKYFYSSRLKRIAPAYFVMLVLVGLVSAVFFIPKDFDTFKSGLEKSAWFNSNNYFASFGDYFAPSNHEQPLLHTWSLAVEIQFYLLAPFLILVLPIRTLKWVILALTILLTAVAEYRLRILGIEQATYYSLYARLPEFFVGSIAAIFMTTTLRKRRASTGLASLGVGIILLAAFIQPELGLFPGIAALLPVIGCLLVLINYSESLSSRFLSCKWMLWVGALSYSLYLWHWPVLALLRYYSGAEILNLTLSVIFVLTTLLLAMASYYWVEKPLRSSDRSKNRRLGYVALGLLVVMASQGMAKVHEAFTPEQLPVEYRRYADPATICHGKIIGDCLRGDLTSDREILVLGDSHGAMLNHFFDYLGQELGFKARVITASSCVTIPEFDYHRLPEWAQKPCLKQIEAATHHVNAVDVIFLAGVWNSHTKSEDFNAALNDFFKQNKEKRIYILSQVPRFKNNPNRARRFDRLGLKERNRRDFDYVMANNKMKNLSFDFENVSYLGFSELSFFDPAPFYKGELIYFDEHHLNEFGALSYARYTIQYFKKL